MSRPNQRMNDEMRPVIMTAGFLKYPQGSVLIEAGDTRVLCSAMVEDKVPPFLKGSGSGWVTAEYSLLPSSSLLTTVLWGAFLTTSGFSTAWSAISFMVAIKSSSRSRLSVSGGSIIIASRTIRGK